MERTTIMIITGVILSVIVIFLIYGCNCNKPHTIDCACKCVCEDK